MKFYGPIGFAITVNDGDGVWKEVITENKYSGDVIQLTRRVESGEHINDGLRMNCQISILCMDPWFHDHISYIRYVEYKGNRWIVESVDPTKYPSVLLTLGGLYHGDEPEKESKDSVPEETGGDSGE